MSKIRKSAQGQACMVRIENICNFDPETTVLAHLNGYGFGGKHHDFQAAYCCSACHDVIDGRNNNHDLSRAQIQIYHYDGIMRTQELLFHGGLIKTPGSK